VTAWAPLEPCYSDDWEECLRELGLSGHNFDFFWRDQEQFLRHYPENQFTEEVPEVDGIVMYPTLHALLDIPPLYVYFYVEPPKIVFLGASPAWAETDLPPPDLRE
jgi:hypothetical protein